MDFTLTDTVAYLTNISTYTFVDDFAGVKDQIPDTVAIQFEPSQPDTLIESLNTGRQMGVSVMQGYDTQHLDDMTVIVVPVSYSFQQLLPLAT